MSIEKLFNRNFSLMVIGQIISLFGNSILRFSLSLYVLHATGSAAVFGTILALSMIPTVLLSPIGGILADRVNRRNIMVALDFTTAGIIAVFTILFGFSDSLILIGAVMILLAVIQSCYQPSVQSSIPVLATDENLERANGIVVQVNALATLAGPIIAGFLYGFFGITPILIISGICFFLSAVMELFLKIPFTKREKTGSFIASAAGDLKTAFRFLSKDNPSVFKLLFIIAGLNLFLSAMITVGLPYIVNVFLQLDSQFYGFAEGALAVGMILGGLMSGILAKKVRFNRAYIFLIVSILFVFPVGFAVLGSSMPFVSYGIILFSIVACMTCSSIFNVFAMTFAQRMTPTHLLGKVSSFVTVISICALPLGQALYGGLFELFKNHLSVVVFFACVMGLVIAFATRRFLRQLPHSSREPEAAPQTEQAGA